MNGLSPEDMERNRNGQSTDPKAEAAGQVVEKDAKTRGHIETGKVEAVCAVGYTDGQIVEMVADTAFGIITNLVNNTSATDLGASFRPMARHRIRA